MLNMTTHIADAANQDKCYHSVDEDLQGSPTLLNELCCHLKLLYCTLLWQRRHYNTCIAAKQMAVMPMQANTMPKVENLSKAYLCWYLEAVAKAMQNLGIV